MVPHALVSDVVKVADVKLLFEINTRTHQAIKRQLKRVEEEAKAAAMQRNSPNVARKGRPKKSKRSGSSSTPSKPPRKKARPSSVKRRKLK